MKPWQRDSLFLTLTVLAVVTYFVLAVKVGVYQRVPVLNFLAALTGCVGLLGGLFQQVSTRRIVFTGVAFALTTFFSWFTLVDSNYVQRVLKVGVGDDLGQQLADLSLTSSRGQGVSLLTPGEAYKATLLVFYRGYW